MQKSSPAWIARIGSGEAQVLQFEQLYELREKITELTIAWPCNTYKVNVSEKYFILNGGMKIRMKGMEDIEDAIILYTRRVRKTLHINCDGQLLEGGENEEISYLLGIQGNAFGTKREYLVHVSQDGMIWVWRDKR